MEHTEHTKIKPNGVALIPLLLFIAIYLGAGIYLNAQGVEMAFYQFPAPVAVLIGIVAAFILLKGTADEKLETFVSGCGNENIIIMCCIYLLAGAFSDVAGAMGGVDSFAYLGLSIIPAQFMTAGIFVLSSVMATATGTSMGTIAAIGPIAVSVAQAAGLGLPMTMAAVMGGAIFGDNLSIISDTTIAATRTQGVETRDKFRMNFTIALPAAVITFVLLMIFARPETAVPAAVGQFDIVKVIPYFVVLITALLGVNVFIVLTIGIALCGAIGIAYGDLNVLTFGQSIYAGMAGMLDVFLTSLLIGGLAEMMRKAGGLEFLISKIRRMIKGEKTAQIGVSVLASVTDLAVANNTVAIIIDGPIAKEISEEYQVDPRRTASLLDIFACVFQGIIPYGAQMLLVGGLTNGMVGTFNMLPLCWYQMLLAAFALLSIFVPFANGVMKKNPWNWEKGMDQKRVERLQA